MKIADIALAAAVAAGTLHAGAADAIECVAHRGYWNEKIPENTVEAIARAYACGANWVETDFNLEEDGRMLCYHDPKRRDEVVKPPFHVPTVDEVLALVPKDRGIQCEIKKYGPDYAEKFDRAVRAAGLSETNVLVSSFNANALKDFKRRKPTYRTIYLLGIKATSTPQELVALGKDVGAFAICPGADSAVKWKWTVAAADEIRAAGFSFRLYGVNNLELLRYASKMKAEAFTCNFFETAFEWAAADNVKLAPKHR